jgi:DNA-binding NarL/FixJ family response regulator
VGIRLLLADPHPVALCGWRQFVLDTEVEVVGQTGDSRCVPELVQSTRPDVLLLDVQLCRGSAAEYLGRLRQLGPELPVVVTLCDNDPGLKVGIYKAAAAGYLLRSTPRDGVLDAIRRSAAGENLWSREELRRIAGVLAAGRTTPEEDGSLTRREAEVLRQMVLGLTNRQIAAAMGISYETVKEHVQHVLEKLGVGDRTQAALWAVRHGFE